MKIAVITGASSGIGKEYAVAVDRDRAEIEEIWLIARRSEKLDETAKLLKKPVKILAIDITDSDCIKKYVSELKNSNADVRLLINNAGFGKLGIFEDLSTDDNAGMVRLNCEAATVMLSVTLPFMSKGAEIINTCSIAAFAPNTRMAVYCSTKAYILSLSKALRSELKGRGINVLAVCPGPMDTEFLPTAGIAPGSSRTFDTLPRVKPDVMAKKSLAASAARRGVYTNLLFYKFYRLLAKLLPHGIVMKMCGA